MLLSESMIGWIWNAFAAFNTADGSVISSLHCKHPSIKKWLDAHEPSD